MNPETLAAILRLCAREAMERARIATGHGDQYLARLQFRIADLLRETSALVTATTQKEPENK